MGPASKMNTLYQVSRSRRFVDLVIQPKLAMAGVAMVAYGASRAWPHLHELHDFLRNGWVAWVAAAPIALITVPFLLLYGSICARAVASCWIDAGSNDAEITEGTVTLAASYPPRVTVGPAAMVGTLNKLSVAGRLFTSVPRRVLKQINVEDRLRVTYTPRVNYVVAIARLESLDAVASAREANDSH
jgi:hypothetical protein